VAARDSRAEIVGDAAEPITMMRSLESFALAIENGLCGS